MTRQTADFRYPRPTPWRWTDTFLVALGSTIAVGAFVALGLLFLLVHPAGASWRPEYAQAPQAVQDWYQRAELTGPAQKRIGFKRCCDKSEVVKSKFKVDSSSGSDEWFYWKDGAWVPIPSDIIHWGEHAPDGMPTLFALDHAIGEVPAGTLTCFYPPDGGI